MRMVRGKKRRSEKNMLISLFLIVVILSATLLSGCTEEGGDERNEPEIETASNSAALLDECVNDLRVMSDIQNIILEELQSDNPDMDKVFELSNEGLVVASHALMKYEEFIKAVEEEQKYESYSYMATSVSLPLFFVGKADAAFISAILTAIAITGIIVGIYKAYDTFRDLCSYQREEIKKGLLELQRRYDTATDKSKLEKIKEDLCKKFSDSLGRDIDPKRTNFRDLAQMVDELPARKGLKSIQLAVDGALRDTEEMSVITTSDELRYETMEKCRKTAAEGAYEMWKSAHSLLIDAKMKMPKPVKNVKKSIEAVDAVKGVTEEIRESLQDSNSNVIIASEENTIDFTVKNPTLSYSDSRKILIQAVATGGGVPLNILDQAFKSYMGHIMKNHAGTLNVKNTSDGYSAQASAKIVISKPKVEDGKTVIEVPDEEWLANAIIMTCIPGYIPSVVVKDVKNSQKIEVVLSSKRSATPTQTEEPYKLTVKVSPSEVPIGGGITVYGKIDPPVATTVHITLVNMKTGYKNTKPFEKTTNSNGYFEGRFSITTKDIEKKLGDCKVIVTAPELGITGTANFKVVKPSLSVEVYPSEVEPGGEFVVSVWVTPAPGKDMPIDIRISNPETGYVKTYTEEVSGTKGGFEDYYYASEEMIGVNTITVEIPGTGVKKSTTLVVGAEVIPTSKPTPTPTPTPTSTLPYNQEKVKWWEEVWRTIANEDKGYENLDLVNHWVNESIERGEVREATYALYKVLKEVGGEIQDDTFETLYSAYLKLLRHWE